MTRNAHRPRGAAQLRRPAGLVTAFVAAAAALASWSHSGTACSADRSAQPPTSPTSSSPATAKLRRVTIPGYKNKAQLEIQVDHFVSSTVAQLSGESLLRWDTPVCPLVRGLPPRFDEFIQNRIEQIARSAHAPVAGKRCRANLYVLAAYHPDALLKKLWKHNPLMFETRNGLGGVERFLHSKRPVRVWYNSGLHCRGVTSGTASMSTSGNGVATQIGSGRAPSHGQSVNSSASTFCTSARSRLSYASVHSMSSVFIVADMTRMKKITTRELADYAAMVGLADVTVDVDLGAVPTILRLFQHPKRPPHRLSAWDRALLYSLYDTRQSSTTQVSDMETTVVKRLMRGNRSGLTASGSSKPAIPAWTDESLPQRNAKGTYSNNVAAQQSNALAQYNQGVKYYTGRKVPQSYAKAALWFRKAADQGDAEAQFYLGSMYANGKGVPRDYATAAEWFRKAAEDNNIYAQYDLGLTYADGRGVPQNDTKAAEWFRKAAAQGNADAQSKLGLAYVTGRGVSRNYATAAKWFRKAADQGDAEAQFYLGNMYGSGLGVPRDDVRAYKWWMLAKVRSHANDQVHALSLHKMTASASGMTAAQIARARQEAAAWLAAHKSVR